MSTQSKIVPLIVASPLFLQNIDTSAMVIALPSIAHSLNVPLLQLNLVITAYMVSLAVFLPLSAWLADRYGAKKIFCTAVIVFSVASALCGMAVSMQTLVLCRVLQGLGGAMMVPVGRLILLRSVSASEMIGAMVWYTVPPLIGRLSGPLIGGAIVSVTSWHWIFFVNIPFGIAAVVLALIYVEDAEDVAPAPPFDLRGFVLLAVGLAAMLGALQTVGKGLVPAWMPLLAVSVGGVALAAYGILSRRQAEPIIDLTILRFRTFRTNVIGAAPLRLALSAIPFLLPLMMQMGFGLSPLQTGAIAAASAFGALCTRFVMRRIIGRFGFRRLLIACTAALSLSYMSHALFTRGTAHELMFLAIFCSGLLSSLCMVMLNTLGFVEIPSERTSHATALTTMAQQLMSGIGVVVAALLLGLVSWLHGGDGVHLMVMDFSVAILVVGATVLLSLLAFCRLAPNEGDEYAKP